MTARHDGLMRRSVGRGFAFVPCGAPAHVRERGDEPVARAGDGGDEPRAFVRERGDERLPLTGLPDLPPGLWLLVAGYGEEARAIDVGGPAVAALGWVEQRELLARLVAGANEAGVDLRPASPLDPLHALPWRSDRSRAWRVAHPPGRARRVAELMGSSTRYSPSVPRGARPPALTGSSAGPRSCDAITVPDVKRHDRYRDVIPVASIQEMTAGTSQAPVGERSSTSRGR
jgi:hypothetical protein